MPDTQITREPTGRLAFLREQHGAALLEAFLQDDRTMFLPDFYAWVQSEDGRPLSDEEGADVVFERYRNADPTRTGACTQWLIRLAIAGNLPAEDLSKARETLEAFLAYKRRLPADQRDLGRYATLGAVWTAVEPYVRENMPASSREEERREREVVRAESDIVLERDGWTVAILKTERAAKWWGRGTRWCTAAESNNMFASYAQDGPLVVFVRPDGAKFQFHAPTQQFMDAADDAADQIDDLDGLPSLLAAERQEGETDAARRTRLALLMALYSTSVAVYEAGSGDEWQAAARTAFADLRVGIGNIPEHLRDAELCWAAVRQDGHRIGFVPDHLVDRDICREAVSNTPAAIRYVPQSLLDRDLAMLAVIKSGSVLGHIPPWMRDFALCAEAIKSGASAVNAIPDHVMDRDLFVDAARRRCWRNDFLEKHADDPFLYRDVLPLLKTIPHDCPLPAPWLADSAKCREIVASNGLLLGRIPFWLRGRDLCLTAVRQNGRALNSVPADVIDRDLCLEAVRQDGSALRDVPFRYRDAEMCKTAVSTSGYALADVPRDQITLEMCRASLENSVVSLDAIPARFWSQELCLRAVELYDTALGSIPDHLWNDDLVKAAVRHHPRALTAIPDADLASDLAEEALNSAIASKGHFALLWLPKHLRTRTVCEKVLQMNGTSIYSVPENILDHDLCMIAVRQNGDALYSIPTRLRDREVCEAALRNNPHVIRVVPDDVVDFDMACDAVRRAPDTLPTLPDRLRTVVADRILAELDASPPKFVVEASDDDPAGDADAEPAMLVA